MRALNINGTQAGLATRVQRFMEKRFVTLNCASRVKTFQALAERMTGVALATLLPALFWVYTLASVAPAFGRTPSPAALALTGAAISLFLVSVCAPIMLRPR